MGLLIEPYHNENFANTPNDFRRSDKEMKTALRLTFQMFLLTCLLSGTWTVAAVFGIYPHQTSVENGVDALKAAGFSNTDISVLFPQNEGTKDFAHKKSTKAPEGASTGAGTGALLGGGLGWLAGIGALAIPGLGPFIAAGPIMAALAGAGVGGAVGGLTGALVGMGIPEYEAKRYEGRVKDGGILLSVHSDRSEETKRAKGLSETAACNRACRFVGGSTDDFGLILHFVMGTRTA